MRRLILLLAIVCLLGLTGCSWDADFETNIGEYNAEQTSGEYIGLSVEEAQDMADENDEMFRVVEEDGQSLAVTMDYRPGRINATVEDGMVVDYYIEGEDEVSNDVSNDSNPDEVTARVDGESYSYYCDDDKSFTVYYGEKASGDAIVNIEDDAVMLTDDADKTTYVLKMVESETGTKYENEDGLVFWDQGFSASLMMDGDMKYKNCRQAK